MTTLTTGTATAGRVTATRYKDFTLHYHQSRALASKARFVAAIAGTGGGKTWSGAPWLAQEIMKHPTDQYLVIAPTYKMLVRATVPTLIDAWRGTVLEGEWNQFRGRLPCGALVWLGSGDRPETLEAGQYRAAWLDEAGQMKRQVWIVIQARLGVNQGRAFITTTPYAVNWLYSDFYKKWIAGDKNYDVIQFRSVDNPYYPQEEFDRARTSMSPEMFEMRYEGQFRKMEGLVYPDFSHDHIVDPFDIPQGWRKAGGIDFGYNNPFVGLTGAVDEDDVLYIYGQHYKARETLKHHSERIEKKVRYAADPSGKQEIIELRRLGMNVKSANNEVALGIEKVNARIRTHRLRVFKTCKELLEEFELYAWDKGVNERVVDKPLKENDHGMDALRYLVMELDGRRIARIRSLD